MIETYCDFTEIILKDTNYKDQISRYFQQTFQYILNIRLKNMKTFLSSSIYNEGKLIATGSGDSKKRAEQDVSKKALIYFNVITAF